MKEASLLRRFLWWVMEIGIAAALVFGQIIHKDIGWINNLSTFGGWLWVIVAVLVAIGLPSTLGDITKKFNSTGQLSDKEMQYLSMVGNKRTFIQRFLSGSGNLSIIVALAAAGWFWCAIIAGISVLITAGAHVNAVALLDKVNKKQASIAGGERIIDVVEVDRI